MLAGRESLIRLIGKRKRTLSSPIAHLLLQSKDEEEAADPSSVVLKEEEGAASNSGVDGGGKQLVKDDAIPADESERVPCPVCGASIGGTDYTINSHLDACLTRGTKRKLTQRTLLQLNFCPISGNKTSLGVSENHKASVRKNKLVGGKEFTSSDLKVKSCSFEKEKNHYASDLSDKYLSNSIHCTDAEMESNLVENTVSWKVLPQGMRLPEVVTCGVDIANFIGVLETFIVGRKFHDNIELQQGAGLSIRRDPENAKDKYAIKVLSADSGSGHMLGFLPRDLAKFLSPLIDNHHLICEGSVISPSEDPLDAVPIQLSCQRMVAPGEVEYDDCQSFEFLWENVQCIAQYAKTNPPSTAKYQQNFHLMVEDVVNNHSHIFTSNEKLLSGTFDSLHNDAQRLFIRIYTRKGPWFRMSNITYPEISDSQRAIEELQLAGYIYSISSSKDIVKYNMEEVLGVLTVPELREVSNLVLPKKAINCTRRQGLIDFLLAAYDDGTCQLLPERVLERAGTCIKISSAADTLLWRVQRLFFLNGEQDLSAFLLSDLGLIKFPDYTCTITQPIFEFRSDLLQYEEAVEVAQIMDESLDENRMEVVIRCINVSHERMQNSYREETKSSGCGSPSAFFSRFSASWVYSKVLSLGVSIFERERRYEDAIRLLKEFLRRITCDSRRGYWTLRLSVDLEHVDRVNESLSVAEEGVLDPWVRAGSRMALQRRVLRLGKPPRRWKLPSYANSVKRTIKEVCIRGRPLTSETGSKNLFYGYDGELCGVEKLSLQYYAGEGGGWQGVHSESGIWMTIFGILMWDAIFADVPDVFRSRFQMAPLDLLTDDFYVARKNLIESHLQKIQEGMAEEILITSWQSHVGTACQGVNWDRHSLSDLRAVVSCIGGCCLVSLCRHLALDYRSWSSGMPDLLLWRFHGGDRDGGEAKLVEVKGPKDRLSEQQRAWILILMDCGFDVEVCKVSPTAAS